MEQTYEKFNKYDFANYYSEQYNSSREETKIKEIIAEKDKEIEEIYKKQREEKEEEFKKEMDKKYNKIDVNDSNEILNIYRKIFSQISSILYNNKGITQTGRNDSNEDLTEFYATILNLDMDMLNNDPIKFLNILSDKLKDNYGENIKELLTNTRDKNIITVDDKKINKLNIFKDFITKIYNMLDKKITDKKDYDIKKVFLEVLCVDYDNQIHNDPIALLNKIELYLYVRTNKKLNELLTDFVGGNKKTNKKYNITSKTINITNKGKTTLKTIYLNKYKTKYIKVNNKFVLLSKFNKTK